MNKIVSIILITFCVSIPLFSQNIFLGKWDVQIQLVPDTLIVEFSESACIFMENGMPRSADYRVDTENRIVCVYSGDTELKFRYVEKGNVIDLYFVDFENSPLYEGYLKKQERISQYYLGINELTDEYYEIIKKNDLEMFTNFPYLRLTRKE